VLSYAAWPLNVNVTVDSHMRVKYNAPMLTHGDTFKYEITLAVEWNGCVITEASACVGNAQAG